MAMETRIEKIRELLANKKFAQIKKMLLTENSADIYAILEELESKEAVTIFRLLNKETAGKVFTYMESDMQEKVISEFTDKELANVMDELYMDDAVDLIEEMPANVVKRILKAVPKEDRATINQLLKYPENTAGSIMTTEFVDIKENYTVEQALARIKDLAIDSKTIYYCYILDAERKLTGFVNIKNLLIADRDTIVKDLVKKDVIYVTTLEDQEEVAKIFNKYDLYALPVTDNEGRLVGIITVDDAIDVLEEETNEDFAKMAAMQPSEEGYFETSVFTHAKNRIVWLIVLMISASVTGMIISHYEAAFEALPMLVAFIPMIMGTGGNCGSQSSTLVIRGLTTDEIELNDIFKVLWKELRVSLVVGLTVAFINGARIYLQYKQMGVAVTIGLTLLATVTLAKCIGCVLPLAAKKLKLDPAVMAAPLITTIVDTLSILVYFKIATVILGI